MKRRPKPAAPTPTPPEVRILYYVESPYNVDWQGKPTYTRGYANEGCHDLRIALSGARHSEAQSLKSWRIRKKKGITPNPKPTVPHRVVRETIIREVMP